MDPSRFKSSQTTNLADENTRQLKRLLLDLIKSHECIWKHDSPDFKNKRLKNKTWKQIASTLNSKEGKCRKQWRYMRQGYASYVRTNGIENRYRSYSLSPHIDFVRPYVALHSCSGSEKSKRHNLQDDEDIPSTADDNSINEIQSEKEVTVVAANNTHLEKQFSELIGEISEENQNQNRKGNVNKTKQKTSQQIPNCSNLKRKRDSENDGNIESKATNSNTRQQTDDLNENSMFFQSVLPFVNEMDKKQVLRFRQKVMIVINDFIEKKYTEPQKLCSPIIKQEIKTEFVENIE